MMSVLPSARTTTWFFIGTAAELIKLYPLLLEADRRGRPWALVSSGQSPKNLAMQVADFGLPRARCASVCSAADDLRRPREAAAWFARSVLRAPARTARLLEEQLGRRPAPGDDWVVHGDTLTTVVGALAGRGMGLRVVHVEAGMRSGDWKNPFPEELDRRIVAQLAHVHLAPDEEAAANLRAERVRDGVVVTGGNTIVDAVADVLERLAPRDLPRGRYAVANLHRFENLNRPARWRQMIDVLVQAARRDPVYLVMHPPTEQKLDDDPAARVELERAGVRLSARLPFGRFLHLLHNAAYVITDGGSNQQECFYLGKPCLILRDATEHTQGLGASSILSRFDPAVIDAFLASPDTYAQPPYAPAKRPTDVIFDALERAS